MSKIIVCGPNLPILVLNMTDPYTDLVDPKDWIRIHNILVRTHRVFYRLSIIFNVIYSANWNSAKYFKSMKTNNDPMSFNL